MPVGYGGVAAIENFNIGLDPLTELPNDFFDHSFSNTTFRFGFNYVVPLGRRAFIHRVDIVLRVNGIIIPGGQIRVAQNFIAAGSTAASIDLFDLRGGTGPGTSSIIGKPFGLLNPGDTLQTFLSSLNCGTSGDYISSIRGVEFDA